MAVRQGRQRRDAAAAGKEQLNRYTARQSKSYRLYLYSTKLTLAAEYFRRVRVVVPSFAPGATPLANVWTAVTPHAPAARKANLAMFQKVFFFFKNRIWPCPKRLLCVSFQKAYLAMSQKEFFLVFHKKNLALSQNG
jgi:hypothetical protein